MNIWSVVDQVDKEEGEPPRTLERHEGITIGDLVLLKDPLRHCIIRYIGPVRGLDELGRKGFRTYWKKGVGGGTFKETIYFGCEMKGYYKKFGKNDGSFDGIRYFKAEPKSSIFCQRSKIRKVLRRSALLMIQQQVRVIAEAQQRNSRGLETFFTSVRDLTLLFMNSEMLDAVDENKSDSTPSLTSRQAESIHMSKSFDSRGEGKSSQLTPRSSLRRSGTTTRTRKKRTKRTKSIRTNKNVRRAHNRESTSSWGKNHLGKVQSRTLKPEKGHWRFMSKVKQDLRVGTTVLLSEDYGIGMIKYAGPLHWIKGDKTYYGIELRNSVGRTNGRIGKKEYFTTKDGTNRGLFVAREKIRKYFVPTHPGKNPSWIDDLDRGKQLGKNSFWGRSLSFRSKGRSNKRKSRKESSPKIKPCVGGVRERSPSLRLTLPWATKTSPKPSKTPSPKKTKFRDNIEEKCAEGKEQAASHRTTPDDDQSSLSGATDLISSPKLPDATYLTSTESQFNDLLTRSDTLDDILVSQYANQTNDAIERDIEDDPMMLIISPEARKDLNSPAAIQMLIRHLQICINCLKIHLPNIANELSTSNKRAVEDRDNIYITHVIQELLKRAQDRNLSKKIRTDFTGTKQIDLESAYSENDIKVLVDTMAWIRNNLCVATLTDENDAMMTLMGAEEVKHNLIGIIKKFDKLPR